MIHSAKLDASNINLVSNYVRWQLDFQRKGK